MTKTIIFFFAIFALIGGLWYYLDDVANWSTFAAAVTSFLVGCGVFFLYQYFKK